MTDKLPANFEFMPDELGLIPPLEKGHCPDCGYRGFVMGPQGGMAFNVECGNIQCRARFNVTRWHGRVAFAQRLPKVSEGGLPWESEPDASH